MSTGLTTEETPRIGLWGAHTESSMQHYVSGPSLNELPLFTKAYIRIKKACATANYDHGLLDAVKYKSINEACERLLVKETLEDFPSPLMAGGGGTATNMNINEVIATLANKINPAAEVHVNDHVNRSQSSNDTYPTAVSMYLIEQSDSVVEAVEILIAALRDKAEKYKSQRRLGRTCLNDALTVPIADTHLAQAEGLQRVVREYKDNVDALRYVPLGGTAVGSGQGAPTKFGETSLSELNACVPYELVVASNYYDSMSNSDKYLAVGQALSRVAINTDKIASDIRLLSSGPRGGFGELKLPTVQAGSSIMPGKVNPMILELVNACMIRIKGNCSVIELAADSGQLEINTMLPVMLRAFSDIHQDLIGACRNLAVHAVDGMVWDMGRVDQHVLYSYDERVEQAGIHGYDTVAQSNEVEKK